MKRLVSISALLVLVISLGFSQEKSTSSIQPKQSSKSDSSLSIKAPQVIYWDNDTVVVVTPASLKSANQMFIDRNRLIEVNDTLNSTIELKDRVINNQTRIIKNYEEITENNDKIKKDCESQTNMLNDLINDLQKEVKKQNRQKRFIGIVGITSIIAILVLK